MSHDVASFLLFWGVWLFVPILIDGLSTLVNLLGGWGAGGRARRSPPRRKLSFYPLVSILVPVYNGADTLRACLQSLREQTYPHDRLEIIVVDNGSTDESFGAFASEQEESFGGMLSWIAVPDRGKSYALNAGIHVAHGSLILNVDADTTLHPDAVLNMACEFEADPQLGSATGAVQVAAPSDTTPNLLTAILAQCEYFEYLASFKIGRVFQSRTNSLYTLAGAFSAFRREVLLQTFLYNPRTVTEDTDLTFELHQRIASARIACVPDALAYVEPVPSLKALYSQRVRWQRGELEVIGWHAQLMRHNSIFRVKGLSPQRLLLVDHTLAFPRMAWVFFFPVLAFFGYAPSLIVQALIVMYVMYAFLDALWLITAYLLCEPSARARLQAGWWVFLFLPAYRFLTFSFRVAGFLAAQTDPPAWQVVDPITAARAGLSDLRERARVRVRQRVLPPERIDAQ